MDINMDIREILEDIMTTQRQILSFQGEMQKIEAARVVREEQYCALVQRHEEFINGNGKPGIKTEMRLINEHITRVNWVGALIAGAIILDMMSRILAK